jgi:hypothetical protein
MTEPREVAQFALDDGTTFLVEIDEPQNRGAVNRISIDTGQMVYQAKETLEAALDKVKPVASAVISKLQSGLATPADEVSVTFGLKLSADAGVVFSSVGGEVTFEVSLTWQKPSPSAQSENA